jgi:hypothetical protein
VTPNSDWWSRAKRPPRPQSIEIRKRETILASHVLLVRACEHAEFVRPAC